MFDARFFGFATIAVLVSTACSQPDQRSMNTPTPAPLTAANDNPLFPESTLPYQLPPLDRIRPEHFKPALEAGMSEQRREIEAITNTPGLATFANTIVPFEKSGQLLNRA